MMAPAPSEEPFLPPAEPDSAALARAAAKRKLLIGTALCTLFMLAEIVGGFIAHSLAVMTDAAHMASDVAGYGSSPRAKAPPNVARARAPAEPTQLLARNAITDS